MNIQFQAPYLSITSFPEIELPDFCLLTGLNGVGKSHFLVALQEGALKSDCGDKQQIRYFDWNSLVPQDQGPISTHDLKNERMEAFQQLNSQRGQHHVMSNLRNFASRHALPPEYVSHPERLGGLSQIERNAVLLTEASREEYDQLLRQAESICLQHIAEQVKQRLVGIAAGLKKPILSLTLEDCTSLTPMSWGTVGIFQQSFGRLFVSYRDKMLENRLAQFAASQGEPTAFLSQTDFEKIYGPPPWGFVNDSLAAAGLDFYISSPSTIAFDPYFPELTKRSNKASVSFSSLSSGEKVLMAFAFCIYYSNDRRQLSTHPKLLLLDEVDAPLHPSMSKLLVNTIQKTLVENYGIKVILATHSPATTALVPDECVYVMKKGLPGLHKSSRAEALNLLTADVPTLAISYEGRRQVFVESPADAKTYDAIYKILKTQLRSERSLEFIATGSRATNTGCDVVKRIVADLSDAGNQSVFGLLDWDGHHKSDKRIAILAEGRRNGLENVVFDPAAIALLICRDFRDKRALLGLSLETSFLSLARLDAKTMQSAVNSVTRLVFGDAPPNTTHVKYAGGLTLEIDSRYLTIDDHELEGRLIAVFPFLQSLSKQQAGVLMQEVIDRVYGDIPEIMPCELRAVLLDLLNRPAH